MTDLAELYSIADNTLHDVDKDVRGRWATPITWRQPVHTLYMPADKFFAAAETLSEYTEYARQQAAMAVQEATGEQNLEAGLVEVAARVELPPATAPLAAHKLQTQPIEDIRIDLEDGFTQRAVSEGDRDADEDHYAQRAAEALAAWVEDKDPHAPSFAGIRFKSFDPLTRQRGVRTLFIVLKHLHAMGTLEKLDERALRLTFPKVQSHHQVTALVRILQSLEQQWGLTRPIPFEVQVEAPQAILGANGDAEPVKIITAAQGRCLSLHYGTYDYSASLGVDAAYQSMEHPVADYAKDMLQVATTSVGVELSDGSTNRIPVGDTESVMTAWQLHTRLVNRHLARGIRQGWDLHPAQLVTRHLTTIAYFRDQWKHSAERLRDYVAGDESRWMDEPATAKAMSSYLRRAFQAGAITEEELAAYNLSLPLLEALQLTGRLSQK
ncbi:hypothetical protein GSS87_08020 [Corynebacterium sp. 4HC-13]|uniref:DUF6986 family protein n=1 Tax=Corynebacterium anserum TaxID=2684406 RepID=UPI00163B3B2B|nr:aldolase/citrate lyase family protein [Corynebacterium anserum]MBC2682340.1 hypothetical protein [Corynebacterium anserum]